MICLCLSGNTLSSWSEQVKRNRRWISMVELRVDLLRPSERNPDAIRSWTDSIDLALPIIITIRRQKDLGRWEGDEAQRAFLLEEILGELQPAYVDLELDRRGEPSWDRIALRVRAAGGTVIRSHHEPRETPAELSQLMARLAVEKREIPKLAVKLNTTDDLVALIGAADEYRARMPGRRALWIGMGEHGMPTRVFPSRLHCAWTYASDLDAGPVAPGQIDARTSHDLYRVQSARDDWPVFAVIGSPVAHSRSPEYHNRRFVDEDRPALYVPLLLDDFSRFPVLAELLRLRGVSVTVPHKNAALQWVIEQAEKQNGERPSDPVCRVGAVNTLLRNARGKWTAENTDIAGFLAPLEGTIERWDRLNAAIIGAGGAARAVVAGLLGRSASVEIFNRTPSRAEVVALDMGLPANRAHPLRDLAEWTGEPFDLIVQTTTVGMSSSTGGSPGDDPVPGYRFRGTETVYDIVYTPPETPFLARARSAGCRTINGRSMFDHQAELQYRLFTALIDDDAAASR